MMQVLVGRKGKGEELKWEDISVEEIATLASTPTLLGGANTFLLVGALASERGEEFMDLAEELVESPHTFVFEEEKLLKGPTEKLKKAGVKIDAAAPVKKEETFNVFGVANLFAVRDRKKLWLSLVQAGRRDVAPEAIAGMLHWKVRSMLSEPRPGKYTREELKKISRELVSMYHDSHRGAGELELLLERFVLKL